ncbi:hypothetical protein PHISCL_07848 [Aspergillus sclerotialis]|uniref:Uncharacterized protein n=1 Tax=Aspergillus sclerotialis TaxID=2070753 RepID=A0A3A2ZER8_9EURO|nr:hypothetical protein PHISCL_07848 [Aspergillus sclerotialis]
MSSDRTQDIDSTNPSPKPPQLKLSLDVGSQTSPKDDAVPPSQVVNPKRQRLSSVSEERPKKNQMFFFVNSKNSSSKEKRAHVMRRHIQEKRKQQQASKSTTRSQRTQLINKFQLPRQEPDPEVEYEINASEGRESESSTADSSASYGFVDITSQSKTALELRSSANSHLASPITILDASRKDPFHSLPIVQSRNELELADYWTSRLSYWSGQNQHLKNQVFRAAMSHPFAFQAAILAYCARWKIQLYGLNDWREFQHHMSEVRKGLKAIQAGSAQIDTDSLTMALSGLALQEERFGSGETAQEYVDQAVQLVRPRTGDKTSAEAYMHYTRYMVIPPKSGINTEGRQWLTTFLRGAEELMMEHNTDGYQLAVPRRQAAFQMGSALFPLLSSGPHPSQVPQNSRMFVLQNAPTRDVSRTAALIYITIALRDFRYSLDRTRRFLEYLFAIVKEHRLDQYPACETLVWLLLEETCDADLKDSERAWTTGELLKLTKQLPPGLQFHFDEILMSFLQLMPAIPGIDVFEKELQKMR